MTRDTSGMSQMTRIVSIKPHDIFESAEDLAALEKIPARWCVALIAGEDDLPIQILCTKNLRRSLVNRLSPGEASIKTKRVDLAAIARRVFFTRVDGTLEMELLYHRAVAAMFAKDWRRLLADRPMQFVHVDAESPFPGYSRVDRLTDRPGIFLGPMLSRSRADAFVEKIRTAFDLCRYPDVLAKSPNGRACAYKEMKQCAAPCDGTVSMDVYRKDVRASLGVISNETAVMCETEEAMRQAASRQAFEEANKFKRRLATVRSIERVRSINDFRFLVIDRGASRGLVKLLVIVGQAVTPAATLAHALELMKGEMIMPRDELEHRRLALLAHYVSEPATGVVIQQDETRSGAMDEFCIARATQELWPKKEAAAELIAEAEVVNDELKQTEL